MEYEAEYQFYDSKGEKVLYRLYYDADDIKAAFKKALKNFSLLKEAFEYIHDIELIKLEKVGADTRTQADIDKETLEGISEILRSMEKKDESESS